MTAIVIFFKPLLFFGVVLLFAACEPGKSNTQQIKTAQELPSPSQGVSDATALDSRIRSVDFGNFDYPIGNGQTWKLRNGRYQPESNVRSEQYPVALAYLAYGDVTSDGVEEALVVLFENVKGTAIPYYVYIYASGRPSSKLLWTFETGDRADGGLRQLKAQDGELVVELYGKGTLIGGELYGTEQVGACCPKSVTRTRYAWNGKQFQRKGEPEGMPNDSRGAPVLMPKYGRTR